MPLPPVIFDMNGLLLDTEQVCLDSFLATRRAFSLPESPETFLRCVGLRGNDTAQIIKDSLTGNVSYDEFGRAWEQRIKAALKRGVPAKTGAVRLVQTLAHKGHSLAVATSTQTEKARRHLRQAGLLQHFEHVVGADKVIRHKPHPEVYHKAAALMSSKAQDCFAFEDSEAGTRAAIASGATTVQIPDLVAPSEELVALGHLIAPTLTDGSILAGLVSPEEMA